MAHLAFHFVAGWLLGTLLASGSLMRAWRCAGPSRARPLARWLVLAWGLGTFACVPSLLSHLGAGDAAVTSPWMNVFLFHPLIRRTRLGGAIAGPALLAACLSVQYLVLLVSIRRADDYSRRKML